jgi:hypothetical protein
MRLFSLGYSASLERKKQYVQSMLHVDPLGLASRWNAGGAAAVNGGQGGEPVAAIEISASSVITSR